MAQNRDKEETEVKLPGNLSVCASPQTISSPPRIPAATAAEISDPPRISSADEAVKPDPVTPAEKWRALKRPREATRCAGSGCRRRIGLMGFRCRCGDVYCPEHRYSDRHDCRYDYKAAGREAIARENPVVRAAKLVKV